MTNRRASGRAAKDSGAEFEAFAEEHHREALRLGILAGPMIHHEPHGKIINGQWVMVGAGVADFGGVLYNQFGTTVVAEAKCRRNYLYKREVEPKQQQHLDTVVRGGGVALLLVRLYGDDWSVDAAIPWQEVPWAIKRSAESLDRVAIKQEWVIEPDCTCYLDRFCPVRGVPVPGVAGGQQRRFPRD